MLFIEPILTDFKGVMRTFMLNTLFHTLLFISWLIVSLVVNFKEDRKILTFKLFLVRFQGAGGKSPESSS